MSPPAKEGAIDHSISERLFRYGPVVVWMGVIFYASSGEFSADNTSLFIGPFLIWLFPNLTQESLAIIHAVIRKLAHFGAYAVLAVFAARAFSTSSNHLLRSRWFLWSLLLIAGYSFLDEYHQSFVPSRTASFYDSLIDISGGFSLLLFLRRRLARRERQRG